MTSETKTELVVFGGLAALAIALWLFNMQSGAGTGVLDALPIGATDGSQPFNPADSLSTVQPNGPADWTINGQPGLTIPTSGGSCGCNTCAASGGFGLTFGQPADLEGYLTANPGLIPTQEQLASWA